MKPVQIAALSTRTIREGNLAPERIGPLAREAGHGAAILADRDFTSGWIRFLEGCRTAGIGPVAGLLGRESPEGRWPGDWLWLARSDHGARILALASGRLDQAEPTRLARTLEHLEHADVFRVGLGAAAWTGGYAERLDAIAVRDPEDATGLRAAERLQVPAIAVHPWRAARASEDGARLRSAFARGTTFEGTPAMPGGDALRPAAELQETWAKRPEALANAAALCAECRGAWTPARQDSGHTPEDDRLLERCAWAGLALRVGVPIPPVYEKQARSELDTIRHLRFAPVFLLVGEWLAHLRAKGQLVGPGRGSASGSVVSWALGITDVDPIAERLSFTRFLNPERISPPDFDVDVERGAGDDRAGLHVAQRDLIAMWEARQGRPGVHALGIAVWPQVQGRSALRFAAKCRGLGESATRKLLDAVQDAGDGEPDWSGLREQDRALAKWAVAHVGELAGTTNAVARHPAGIALGTSDFEQGWPVVRLRGDDAPLVQTDLEETEGHGAVKVDVLSSETLMVLRGLREEVDADRIWNLPEEPEVYAKIRGGHTTGMFQLESPGMRRAAQAFAVADFGALRALLAIYRPGPMEQMEEYTARARGERPANAPDPALEACLSDTQGIIVYQEQVMEAGRRVAGLSESEADELRRAIGKKKPEEMQAMRTRFLDGAQANGLPPERAVAIWRLLETHAHYGFNRAHATAYARITYATAWYATHHPGAFYAACCTAALAHPDTDRTLARIAGTAAAHGIGMRGPWLHRREAGFHAHEKDGERWIEAPLEVIAGVGRATADRLRARSWPRETKVCSEVLREEVPEGIAARLEAYGCHRRRGTVDPAPAGEKALAWAAMEPLPAHAQRWRLHHGAGTTEQVRPGGRGAVLAVVLESRERDGRTTVTLADEVGLVSVDVDPDRGRAPPKGRAVLAVWDTRNARTRLLAWEPAHESPAPEMLCVHWSAAPPLGWGRQLEAALEAWTPGATRVVVRSPGGQRALDRGIRYAPALKSTLEALWPSARVEHYPARGAPA